MRRLYHNEIPNGGQCPIPSTAKYSTQNYLQTQSAYSWPASFTVSCLQSHLPISVALLRTSFNPHTLLYRSFCLSHLVSLLSSWLHSYSMITDALPPSLHTQPNFFTHCSGHTSLILLRFSQKRSVHSCLILRYALFPHWPFGHNCFVHTLLHKLHASVFFYFPTTYTWLLCFLRLAICATSPFTIITSKASKCNQMHFNGNRRNLEDNTKHLKEI